MNAPSRFDGLDCERLAVLAAYLRSQVALSHRPPVGRVELNDDEASLCAEVLERFLAGWDADQALP